MKTSVRKDILDDSISGDKVHGGSISGLLSIETDYLQIPTSGKDKISGAATIDGDSVFLGLFSPIGQIRSKNIYSIGNNSRITVLNASSMPVVESASISGSGELRLYSGGVMNARLSSYRDNFFLRKSIFGADSSNITGTVLDIFGSIYCSNNINANSINCKSGSFESLTFRLGQYSTVLLSSFYNNYIVTQTKANSNALSISALQSTTSSMQASVSGLLQEAPTNYFSGFQSRLGESYAELHIGGGECTELDGKIKMQVNSGVYTIGAPFDRNNLKRLASNAVLSNNSWVYSFAVGFSDGTATIGFDDNPNASNLIENHSVDRFRRLGAYLVKEKIGDYYYIYEFVQSGDTFMWYNHRLTTITSNVVSGSQFQINVKTPSISCSAILNSIRALDGTTSSQVNLAPYYPGLTIDLPNTNVKTFGTNFNGDYQDIIGYVIPVGSDKLITARTNSVGGNMFFTLNLIGYIDNRGKY
jgi:hypothetical protein